VADFVGAVDQGTTSTRFMIFDHGGNEVARHQLEHEQILPQAGWVEHNPVEILERTVTVALAVFKGFEWRKVLPYSLAQFLGAFVAALIVRWTYSDVLHAKDPFLTIKTQGVFSTLPGNGALPVSHWTALLDQIVGTAILLFLILAITDERNTAPTANLAPFIIGLLVVGIGMAWGTNAGYAINPARDFGPRLASFLTGYGGAFRDQTGYLYFWIPIVGPLIGGLLGAGLYQALIARFLPSADEPQEPGRIPTPPGEETLEATRG
jgi:glycerol uptake facilitator protein